ncbi:hypothetical protein [Hornefia butyriciproducens]|uniref:hypothetical protein n=1 Tax=Hornefia butyriciproducens TaxID=2652293 RepID=UPI0019808755|nr:hypothetical protein [Hornefia butyriciproducens]
MTTIPGAKPPSSLRWQKQNGYDFITLVKTNISWVKSLIDKHMEELSTIFTAYPYDATTHGVSPKLHCLQCS